MGDDVLDGPLSRHARLGHVLLAVVGQQRLPLVLFGSQVVEELGFARCGRHAVCPLLQMVVCGARRTCSTKNSQSIVPEDRGPSDWTIVTEHHQSLFPMSRPHA